jgi:hypothetical protein
LFLCDTEATERLEAFNSQITRAAERYARVVVHGDLNLDLDRSGDPLYAQRNLLTMLLESTEAAGLETHRTPPTWHSYGLHRVRLGKGGSRPGDGGDDPGSGGDRPGKGSSRRSNGGEQLGKGGGRQDEGGDDSATVPSNSATVPTNPTHAVPTRHAWTTCTCVASCTRPRECWGTAPRTTARSSPRSRPEDPKRASSSSGDDHLKPSAGRLSSRPSSLHTTGQRFTPSRTWRRSTSSSSTASARLSTWSPL